MYDRNICANAPKMSRGKNKKKKQKKGEVSSYHANVQTLSGQNRVNRGGHWTCLL